MNQLSLPTPKKIRTFIFELTFLIIAFFFSFFFIKKRPEIVEVKNVS